MAVKQQEFVGRQSWSNWPRYEAAETGFRNYWYPVLWSRDLKAGKPMSLKLLDEQIMFFREKSNGAVYSMRDRCPHRGVPISAGSQEFENTFSCPYHGWTFDLASGELVAAIPDGPDSPICGKVAVMTYPVEERLGLVWVFIGNMETPPPVEADIPEELINTPSLTLGGRITDREANWRFGTENGFDEGHAKWLHRFAWMTQAKRQRMPAWTRVHIETDGTWVTRVIDEMKLEDDYPGLGKWPPKLRWFQKKKPAGGPEKNVDPVIEDLRKFGRQALRLPCNLRILRDKSWVHYDWCIGIDKDHYRYVQIAVRFKGGVPGLRFKALYGSFLSWIFHGQFTGQDEWMVHVTDAPPERLFRPDVSLVGWRNLCEHARTGDEETATLSGDIRDDVVEAIVMA